MSIYYDISVPISAAMPIWPGDPPIDVKQVSSINLGDKFNLSRLEFGTHTLTHVDAPRHFIERGLSVDRLPLDILIGSAVVVQPGSEGNLITAGHLDQLDIHNVERLLIKTGNSNLWAGGRYEFEPDFVSLSNDAAHWLVSKGIKLVGIDYLSIEAFSARDLLVHHTLLEKGIVILEGIDLSQVPEGRYQLICLPLKVRDGDGAPARVVLTD